MESSELLVLLAGMFISGMLIMSYVFLRMISSMSSDLRTIAMFRKSRTREDLVTMKQMGINDESWEKEEEVEEEAGEELYTADNIPEDVLIKIAESDGSE
jgi:hypothetical protein